MLSLNLFGHFRATFNEKGIIFPTKSVSALVAYLILEQHAPQPRAHIAPLLWPDSTDEQGRRNLRQTLLRLRQSMPDTAESQPLILTVHDTLQWNPAYPAQIDLCQFKKYMAQAEPFLHTSLAETPYPAIAPLRTALEFYGGNLLLGFDLLNDFYAAWLQSWREQYLRQALAALARLAESYGRAGQPQLMAQMAQRQLAIAPEREEGQHQLMQAYLAQGEYTAALNQYATYQQHLEIAGLEAAPTLQRLYQLAVALRLGQATPLTPIPHNLPPEETPFYGRQDELDDLLLWLAAPDQRLLTLIGLGGIGKTRLALTAARHLTRPWLTIPPRFPGGVWFASLAELQRDDEGAMAEAIVQSCGWQTQPDETALAAAIRYLQSDTSLLILDNLEHLSGMANLLLQLLTAVPTLTVLATSRHRLGLQREVIRQLRGLPTPNHEGDMAVPSVTLFTERMRRVTGDFQLTLAVAPDLAYICRALDGWPLALELAASWGEVMDVREIAGRVAGNLAALQTTMPDLPARHRSIEAALTGSYSLLTPTQQSILARFALLRGGCTVEAAEKILAAPAEDMALLARRALLHEYEGRYTIHELIHQFSRYKLEQMADKIAAEQDHADYYLELVATLESNLYGPNPLPAVHQLRPERENIYWAWHWAAENGRYGTLAAALPGLIRFYNLTGLLREGEALLRETLVTVSQLPLAYDLLFAHTHLYLRLGNYVAARALLTSLPPLETLSPSHQLKAHLRWGELTIEQNHIPESRHHTSQSLALARALGDQAALIVSLMRLHILHDYKTTYQADVLHLTEGLSDHWLQQQVYTFLGGAFIRDSHYNEARTYWQKALAVSLELADNYSSAALYNNLGDAWRELGQFTEAEQSFQQALILSDSLHNKVLRMNPLEGAARLCVLRGDYEKALTLAQEAIDLTVTYERPVGQMAALACLGHAYTGLALWVQAQDAYGRAAVLVPDLPHLAMESKVGLAYISLRQGDETAACAHIKQFLDMLAHSRIEGSASPSLSYGRAAEVLRALGEEQMANEVFAMGQSWLPIAPKL